MMRPRIAEKVVAPVESEAGSGTTSSTMSGRPDVLLIVAKVRCSKAATAGLAAVATSSTAVGAGWNAPYTERCRTAVLAVASES
jgi:hypothetical protein